MAVDLQQTFSRGGRALVGLLDFCVLSVKMDPLFVFLVGEFRVRPTAAGAIALYDVFCAVGAPARVSVTQALPPRSLRLQQVIEPLRQDWDESLAPPAAAETADGIDEDSHKRPPPAPIPGKYLFDDLATAAWSGEQIAAVARQYDPALEPRENLPGGRLTAAQKAFVDYMWEPRIRPCLVGAGFRRVANIA